MTSKASKGKPAFSLNPDEHIQKAQASTEHASENGQPPVNGHAHPAEGEQAVAEPLKQQGFQEARQAQGRLAALPAHLDALYEEYAEEVRKHRHEQEAAKQPYREQLEALNTEKRQQQSEKDQIDRRIERSVNRLSELEQEKQQIRDQPDQWLNPAVNTSARIRFVFGTVVLVILTAYLILFYSSAAFSAFFRQFETGVRVTQTLFDPAAFAKAYEHILSGLFITTIPIVFLALGFLVYQFTEDRSDPWRYLKTALLVSITFLFDALLAYEIELKLYEATKTINDPPFNPAYAVQAPEFWIILFAGFVVYIVWGLVCSFTMHAYEHTDALRHTLLSKEQEQAAVNARVEADNKQLDQIENTINKVDAQMEQKRSAMERTTAPPPRAYKQVQAQYLKGWIAYLAACDVPAQEIEKVHKTANRKLAELTAEPVNPSAYE